MALMFVNTEFVRRVMHLRNRGYYYPFCYLLRRSFRIISRQQEQQQQQQQHISQASYVSVAPSPLTYVVRLALEHVTHLASLHPSTYLPRRLAPSYYFSSCYALRASSGRWSHRARPTEQGPHYRLPRFAEPRRDHRNPCASCEESTLKVSIGRSYVLQVGPSRLEFHHIPPQQ